MSLKLHRKIKNILIYTVVLLLFLSGITTTNTYAESINQDPVEQSDPSNLATPNQVNEDLKSNKFQFNNNNGLTTWPAPFSYTETIDDITMTFTSSQEPYDVFVNDYGIYFTIYGFQQVSSITFTANFSQPVNLDEVYLLRAGLDAVSGEKIEITSDQLNSQTVDLTESTMEPIILNNFKDVQEVQFRVYAPVDKVINTQFLIRDFKISYPYGKFNVSFNSNEGSPIADLPVFKGDKIPKPADPEKDGYEFDGWYKDENLTVPVDFDNEIMNADLTLFAKWEIPYTMAPIDEQILESLTTGYLAGSQEEKEITLTRTGLGDLKNIQISLGGYHPDMFEITPPLMNILDDTNPSTKFTIKAIDDLTEGNYETTVTVTADKMKKPLEFNVRQNVFTPSFISISAGGYHNVSLMSDGTVWTWGSNNHGQLGNGKMTSGASPLPNPTLIQVKKDDGSGLYANNVSAGLWHTLALDDDGKVWAWGSNDKGQLGTGESTTEKLYPVQVTGLDNVISVSAGAHHNLALKNDGTVWVWGDNSSQQQGNGNANIYKYESTPKQVMLENGTPLLGKSIEAGDNQSLIIDEENVLWHWGKTGELQSIWPVPVKNADGTNFIARQVSAGNSYVTAIDFDRNVWSFGDNYFGQFGNGKDKNASTTPVKALIQNVKLVAAGYGHTLAIKRDGTVWAWGDNYQSSLGDLTNKNKNKPVRVINSNGSSFKDARRISAGGVHFTSATHSVAIKDGELITWGSNRWGQLGNGTTDGKNYAEDIFDNTFTVTYILNGGSSDETMEIVNEGDIASIPQNPIHDSRSFDGWYADEQLTTIYNFDQPVTTDIQIYAKWKEPLFFEIEPIDNQAFRELTAGYSSGIQQAKEITIKRTGTGELKNVAVTLSGKDSDKFEVTQPSDTTLDALKANTQFTIKAKDSLAVGTYTATVTISADNMLNVSFIVTQKVNIKSVPKPDPKPVPSPNPSLGPTSEEIVVDVVDDTNPNERLVQTPITRTTGTDGTIRDSVTFTPEKASESVEKLKSQQTKTARIVIPDIKDQVSETKVNVPKQSIYALNQGKTNLSISTENGSIFIPSSSLTAFTNDLYFRIVPVKKEDERKAIETRAKQEKKVKEIVNNHTATIQILGRPMTIETNMQSHPVILTFRLPKNLSQEVMDNLAIFIEHSDSTKEVVSGKVVEMKKGVLGVQFTVTKFSTFTTLFMEGANQFFSQNLCGNSSLPSNSIGCLKIKKTTPIYGLIDNRLKKTADMQKGKFLPVYQVISPMLGLGGNIWVERTDAVLYETPAKEMLEKNALPVGKRPKDQQYIVQDAKVVFFPK